MYIDKENKKINDNEINEVVLYLKNKKEIWKRNIIAGIARGIGSGIGFTIVTAIIIYFLQRIVRLNIPIIGEYIKDIVDIVAKSKL